MHVLAIGKAAPAMARAALDELNAVGGFVLSPTAPISALSPLTQLQGGHPSPSPDAPNHARQIIAYLRALGPADELVCLISGGGSALLELPRAGLSLDDLSRTSELMMHAGASIQDLNVVRRALSEVKGGGLLNACANTKVTNFILSDVVGGPLHAVASGPTLPVHERVGHALELLEDFGVRSAAPASVIALLEGAANGANPSIDPSQRRAATVRRVSPPNAQIPTVTPATWLVADNDRAVRLLAENAQALGYTLQVPSNQLKGDAATAGERLMGTIGSLRPAVGLAWGGETTVTIETPNPGRGGRSQELIAGAARAALGSGKFQGTLVCFGSDGIDGQSPAAGALMDSAALSRLNADELERALAAHDCFSLLERTGAVLITGPTGTNVADLLFWLP